MHDYHPMLTDRPGDTIDLEADHCRHAVVELATVTSKPAVAHVPSGKFAANAAWLVLACLAHNIARWTLRAAGAQWADATSDTLRHKIITMPARLVHGARTIKLRSPRNWPWADAYQAALTTIRAMLAPT